jgi:hypothetical protein
MLILLRTYGTSEEVEHRCTFAEASYLNRRNPEATGSAHAR